MPDLSREEALQLLIPLLQQHAVFTDFSSQEIADFANRADFAQYEQGTKIIRQGDRGDSFGVVIGGQLRAIDVDYDPPQLLNYLNPGSIFGSRALLEDTPRQATIEVIIDARLALFNKDDWTWLRHQNDRVVEYFSNLEREYERPGLIDFPGRQWDEIIVMSLKRHILALLAKLPLPLALLITPVLFLTAGELLGIRFFASANLLLTILFALPFVILAAALALFYYLDWRNDDFIVTTKRLIHIERILLYGEQRDEAPLTRIQDVTLISIDLLDRLFDYNSLAIRTAGTGTMRFNGIPQANEMRETIFREQEQAKARLGAADLGAVRQSLAESLEWEDALEKPVAAVAEEAALLPTQSKTRHLPGLFDYLWPRTKEVNEDESGETIIIWRKHYFILLTAVFLPGLALLLSGYLLIASLIGVVPFEEPAGALILGLLGLAVLASMVWYLFRYDGWRRDSYILTNSRIVDVEATPFRLRGEQRTEGTFGNIQNITYDIPNFFSQLLNLGDVTIETAGTERTFTFEKVFKPSLVQEEIFNRMVRFQQRQRERERDSNTDRLVEVIKEYHHLSQKVSQSSRRQ